jgi:hypothetical protein
MPLPVSKIEVGSWLTALRPWRPDRKNLWRRGITNRASNTAVDPRMQFRTQVLREEGCGLEEPSHTAEKAPPPTGAGLVRLASLLALIPQLQVLIQDQLKPVL